MRDYFSRIYTNVSYYYKQEATKIDSSAVVQPMLHARFGLLVPNCPAQTGATRPFARKLSFIRL
jgi:hypothetical protein